MAVYKAPLKDIHFVLNEVLDVSSLSKLPGYRGRHARHDPGDPRGSGQALRERAVPAQSLGRRGGLHLRERRRAHAQGLQGRLRQVPRGRLDRHDLRSGVRRPGPAGDGGLRACRRCSRRRTRPSPCIPASATAPTRRCRAHGSDELKKKLPAQAHRRHLDGHDVPDRAPLRHRPRHAAHQGRAAGRRQLLDHRHQDLHLGRRARPRREHPPPGAGAPAGCAGRHQGHLAVPGAEVHAQGRRQRRRAQRHPLRRHRAQDGHQGQRHLRHEPRRRQGLAGRRAQQGHARRCS